MVLSPLILIYQWHACLLTVLSLFLLPPLPSPGKQKSREEEEEEEEGEDDVGEDYQQNRQ